jgi:ABC-2 type transport system permease protein
MMRPGGIFTVLKKELVSYVATPVGTVFMVMFLVLSGVLTFYPGALYERGEADLNAFFMWHPWLYLFLLPAVTMRLWSEEYKTGTLELLMSLPLTAWQMVVGKFLAAWCFVVMTLLGTCTVWASVSYLGEPDHGVILASYVGSIMMAGCFLAIGLCMSALTHNQVVAYVLSVAMGLVWTVTGYPMILSFFTGWLPQLMVDVLASFSLLTHFDDMRKGILNLGTLLYLVALIAYWLFFCHLLVEKKKG